MSRRVYRLGMGLALVALALAFTDWALSLQPGVTEANVRRIQQGMSLGKVEAILGGPPMLSQVSYHGPMSPDYEEYEECKSRSGSWLGDGGAASVSFDRNGLVVQSAWYPSPAERPDLLARLRVWLAW